MNEQIIKDIANNLNIKVFQVENTLKLLEEGSTIPFIARYRKEATSGLDEKKIKEISDVYKYQVNLLKRKEDVMNKNYALNSNVTKVSSIKEMLDLAVKEAGASAPASLVLR